MFHLRWHDLPGAAREAVERHTGPVLSTTPERSGVLALTATTPVFVKGVPDDHVQVHLHDREAAVNPWLPAPCPRLKWRVRAGGWDLLGYDHIDGRPAAFTPGSPDLPPAAQALRELQNCPAPGVELRRAERRWSAWVRDGDVRLLAGTTLLHTGLAPDDVLVTGGRAHLVDWAQATVGAAWIDPALLILRLMEAGHSARDADAWARGQFASWAGAPRAGVGVFSEANSRVEQARSGREGVARAAGEWARYWRSAPPR